MLFGSGGRCGCYGAHLQQRRNQRWIRQFLGLLVMALSLGYLSAPLSALCIVDNPGSKLNPSRPGDADVPASSFSPLASINHGLPQWLCFAAGYRARLESYSAGNFRPGNADSYLLTRFRLGLLIRPSHWAKAYVELQDAPAFWKSPPLTSPYQGTWDLRRAYVDLGDTEQSPFSLRVGRQDLSFGFLVGTPYWRNVSRGYDAAMLVIVRPRFRLSAWAASPVLCFENGMCHHQQGNNFHGIYTSLNNVLGKAVLEPYVLWRLSPGLKTEAGSAAKLDEKTIGARWAGATRNLDYEAEFAGQTGRLGADQVRAWGWSVNGGYTFSSSRYKPRVFAKYDFASGDHAPRDGVRGTFDQLYPNNHDQHGLADQLAWQNLRSIRAGVRLSIRPNWMLSGAYNDWWLASANDGFYGASGAIVARDPSGRSGTHIGREYDVQSSYRLNRNLEFGVGLGYIRACEFLVRTNRAHSYTYPYVMLNYNVN
jgi:hypothetical protein